ncbi:hypothetical protein BHE74_00049910 [Ensete ventricosum]|nr:hypothetical protein BHE74_00049910 [Ensete ventricosum]RZS20973.1 hypothetical protein BHM03_00053555 [Ensete ventricosum]
MTYLDILLQGAPGAPRQSQHGASGQLNATNSDRTIACHPLKQLPASILALNKYRMALLRIPLLKKQGVASTSSCDVYARCTNRPPKVPGKH